MLASARAATNDLPIFSRPLMWWTLVEECHCFGWIDSLPGKLDDLGTRTYISPRKRRSGWSLFDLDEDLVIPQDLEQAFARNPAGRERRQRDVCDVW